MLVDNKTVLSLQVEPSELPAEDASRATASSASVAEVAGMSYEKIKREIQQMPDAS